MVKTAAAAPKIEDEEKKAEEAGDYPPLFKAGDKVEPRARVNLPVPMLPESVLSSSTNTSATASSTVTNNGGSKGNISKEEKEQEEQQEQEEEQDDDEDDDDDVLDTITYEVYKPQKLGFGRPHPDPVVENATLASVEPPEITYTLAIPKNVISKGILSDLQLEALVYGCQCHELDLPSSSSSSTSTITITSTTASNDKKISPNKRESPESNRYGAKKEKEEAPPVRRGFMLGDGAGMGKGRTLAGMILENMSRGRTKHIWVSVSSDLYEVRTFIVYSFYNTLCILVQPMYHSIQRTNPKL